MLLSRALPRISRLNPVRRLATQQTRFLSQKTSPFPSRSTHSRQMYLTSGLLGLSLPFFPRRLIRLDSSPVPTAATGTSSSAPYSSSKTPLMKNSKLNPAAVKQISLGSLLGLGAGVLLSAFSRSLTLLVGVGIVVVQYAARKGYNVVPVERVQRYVKGVDVRGLVRDNVAFKISFGLMFALTALGEF